MSRMIPALKCPPEIVPTLVTILYECAENREEIDLRIIETLKRISRASPRNLLRAYAAPTLNNLGLAEGEGQSWRCSPDGISLALALRQSEAVGLRRFGYLLYQRDDKHGLQVIQELQRQKADVEPFPRHSLGELLYSRYAPQFDQNITLKILLDRLGKWLGYLAYVHFVGYVLHDDIRLFPFEVEASLKDEDSVWDFEVFKDGLIAAYESLRVENPSLKYIPIPDLRQRLYEIRFMPQSRAFSTVAFDDALRKLPKATDEYVILLSPPGRQSGGGIRMGEKYYYYISIHRHKKEK